MKALYVMRHAKSSWGEPGLDDFDRPLLEKGKKRSRNIIEYFLKKEIKPELILSSPAVRSIETAKIMAHGLGVPKESIREEKLIYTADSGQLENLFYDLPKSITRLMLIGHNPAVTNFVNTFLESKIDALPTSGVVGLDFQIDDWSELIKGKPELLFIVYPKMLGST